MSDSGEWQAGESSSEEVAGGEPAGEVPETSAPGEPVAEAPATFAPSEPAYAAGTTAFPSQMPPVAAAPAYASAPASSGYPISVDVETPDQIDRWRPVVQWIMAIPLFIVAYVLGIVAEICAFIGWFAALFTGELPESLGNFIAGYLRYYLRAVSYAGFLRVSYPQLGPELGYADPGNDPARFDAVPGQPLSRLPVLLRIIFVIPQAIALFFLGIALYVAIIVGWFAVIITGAWPSGLRNFVVGALRWILRVQGWFFLLADPYPPFSLD